MNEKALRAGCASRGVEVSCKQHRSSAKELQATLCSAKDFEMNIPKEDIIKRLQDKKYPFRRHRSILRCMKREKTVEKNLIYVKL